MKTNEDVYKRQSLNIIVRGLVADQALTVQHLCAVALSTLHPVTHRCV